MKKLVIIVLKLLLVIILTALTQVGGIVYLFSQWISDHIKIEFRFKKVASFFALYLFTTFLIIPLLAPLFGREKIEHTNHIKPTNYITVLLNRNYVVPAMNKVLEESEKIISGSKLEIHYLDACFPFIDKFPLLPHLSHNDGKKLDLSFIYLDGNGKVANKERSVTGYGVFVEPGSKEKHQSERCLTQGFWQYDMAKYISFGSINSDLKFSERMTKRLIESIIKQKSVKKIFIEPHLKDRLSLTHSKVRFHGCHAVRHDDHIHIEVR